MVDWVDWFYIKTVPLLVFAGLSKSEVGFEMLFVVIH